MTDLQSPSWSFGDPTGWAIACGVFLMLSIGLGWAVYGISYRLLTMGSLDRRDQVRRWPSAMGGFLVALVIFSMLYATSLSGFLQLDYRNGQLAIHYTLPSRTVMLPFIEVMNVQEAPAFKGRWRLVLTTDTSGTHESALASYDEVRQAGAWIRRQMRQP
ncbi:MAG: hypothetical protein K2Q17_17240 [Nitrospiraceae bacterium]|uniref:hypothetical protein n=1 Tax=Nitrospira cf. moscoviensis SBR1015 TaxID=96242 RepID=UPI000A0A32AC|nr:hypothetical protein [Nitrospira cf. moscoviensis SBR1015]MBY0249402.1 hypothetical protein [Nitrospiraceae bacterium]OQW34584.1 MAG: hypothetical protein A4E20_10625 [Nitrospira sp. SG-bin2]